MRTPTDAQALTTAPSEAAILRIQTLEELDARFADFLDYAQLVLAHSADSRRGYKGTYGNFRQFLRSQPDVPLAQKLCDIEGWLAWNRKRTIAAHKPLSSVTLNTYFRQLRPFFRDLEYRDGIPNPFDTVRPPKLPTVRLPKARSFEECQHILATAEHRDWPSAFERWRAVAILATFLHAGLRKGEVLRLCFGHVDFSGSKGLGTILVDNSKGEADRIVPMAPELRMILARYVRERRLVFGENVGPAFFTSTQTGQGISESTLRRIVSAIRRASGVAFSMHSLRHSFITIMLNNGSGIHVAQRAAGHRKITTTAMYLSVTDDDLRREMRKVSFRNRRG